MFTYECQAYDLQRALNDVAEACKAKDRNKVYRIQFRSMEVTTGVACYYRYIFDCYEMD